MTYHNFRKKLCMGWLPNYYKMVFSSASVQSEKARLKTVKLPNCKLLESRKQALKCSHTYPSLKGSNAKDTTGLQFNSMESILIPNHMLLMYWLEGAAPRLLFTSAPQKDQHSLGFTSLTRLCTRRMSSFREVVPPGHILFTAEPGPFCPLVLQHCHLA